jgi:hypothetical protein
MSLSILERQTPRPISEWQSIFDHSPLIFEMPSPSRRSGGPMRGRHSGAEFGEEFVALVAAGTGRF